MYREKKNSPGIIISVQITLLGHPHKSGKVRSEFRSGIKVLTITDLWWLSGKESAGNAGDQSLIPSLGRSPAEGNDYPP